MLPVASGLVARGHEVTVLTGSRFGSVVEAAGIAFRTLTGSADIDDRNPDSFLPDRHRYKGLRLAQYQLRRMFVDPVPVQYHDVTVALRATDADAVVVDAMFLGALRFWTSRRAYRSSRWESHRCHYRARTFRSPCRRTSSATLHSQP